MPTKGLSTLNPDSNWFSNRIAQCEFNANLMRIDHPHCIVWELNSRLHVDFKWPHLHTATMAPSSDLYFSQPSYCFSSWADTWNTVCSPEKRAHCRQAYMPRPFWSLRAIAQSSSIQIETTSGSGLGLIRIGSGLGECAFSVDALKPDSIRFNAHWVSSVDRP